MTTPSELAKRLQGKADAAYCDMISQARRPECLGWEYKAAHGQFGQPEFDAHKKCAELYGKHVAYQESANELAALLDVREGWVLVPTRAIELLRSATYQSHNGHWDNTGGSGSGCPECIKTRELRNEADKLLAAKGEGK